MEPQAEESGQSFTLTVLAIVFLVLMLIGLTFNCAAFYTYQKVTMLQTPPNLMIMGCVLCDITMLLIGFPFVIAACFEGKWVFGTAWCQGYGFITTLVGVTNVCILVAIALDRYFIVMEKPFGKRITTFKAGMTILSCWGYGLLWATFPLAGWGSFVEEHSRLSCGPDWANHDSLPLTYNVTMFILVFIVPLSLISYCYFHILAKLYNRKSMTRDALGISRKKESTVAINVFITICSFIISWLPYVILSLWSMNNDVENVSEKLALVAPLMAKSASVWNPMVYIFLHKDFRLAVWELIVKPVLARIRGTPHQVHPIVAESNTRNNIMKTVIPFQSRII